LNRHSHPALAPCATVFWLQNDEAHSTWPAEDAKAR